MKKLFATTLILSTISAPAFAAEAQVEIQPEIQEQQAEEVTPVDNGERYAKDFELLHSAAGEEIFVEERTEQKESE